MGSMVKILVHVYKNSFTRQVFVTNFLFVFEPILPRYSNEYLSKLPRQISTAFLHTHFLHKKFGQFMSYDSYCYSFYVQERYSFA
jgi:hypothetical protein